MNDLTSFRPSRAVPRVERAPLCVNQTEAIKVIGSPKLLKDLEGEGLIVPVSLGKPKWYSVVNLQRAVLEKVRRNQAIPRNANSRGFLIVPSPVLSLIGCLAEAVARRLRAVSDAVAIFPWLLGARFRVRFRAPLISASGAGVATRIPIKVDPVFKWPCGLVSPPRP